jgi:peptidoglycan/xylan/chitin deacetylase (PgdA/CDA1 family)
MSAVKQLVKRASITVDRVVPPKPGITVLIYHRVGGGSDSAVDLPAATFEAHLEHLRRHHRVLTLDAAVDELSAPSADPVEPAVVLTFDDGTADFTDVAVPLLARHEIPATLYAATSFIDEGVPFPWGAPPTSWSALRDACSTGFVTVGSHTHTHRLLDRLPAADAADDLDRSIELIGAEVGRAPEHFAYPKAVPPSPPVEIEVRRRFRSATLAGGKVNCPGRVDLLRIGRTPIQTTDTPEQFAAKACGGFRLEGSARAAVAAVRYRGMET